MKKIIIKVIKMFKRLKYKRIFLGVCTIVGLVSGVIGISNELNKTEEHVVVIQKNEELPDTDKYKLDFVSYIYKLDISPNAKDRIITSLEREDIKSNIKNLELSYEDSEDKVLTAYSLSYYYGLDLNFEKSKEWIEFAIDNDSYTDIGFVNLLTSLYLNLGEFNSAIIVLKKILNETATFDKIEIIKAKNNLAIALMNTEAPYESINLLLEIIKELTPLAEAESQFNLILATVYDNISQAYSIIKENEKSLYYTNKSVEIFKESKEQGEHYAISLNNSALQYLSEDNLELAVLTSRKAVDIIINYPNNLNFPSILDNYGMINRLDKKFDVAKEYGILALSSSLLMYGEEHITTAIINNNLGLLSMDMQMYSDSLAYFQKSH